jgi:hypothetical protein
LLTLYKCARMKSADAFAASKYKSSCVASAKRAERLHKISGHVAAMGDGDVHQEIPGRSELSQQLDGFRSGKLTRLLVCLLQWLCRVFPARKSDSSREQ